MLSVVNSLKIFREQYLMAGGYPDMMIYQIQHIFNNWFEKLEISKLTAGAVLTALVVLWCDIDHKVYMSYRLVWCEVKKSVGDSY